MDHLLMDHYLMDRCYTETEEQYASRLRRAAMQLPRGMVGGTLSVNPGMRKRILAVVAAGGRHIKMD